MTEKKKDKILIIDDDVETREMYSEVFTSANYEVIEASDGVEGLDNATKELPDIIFTGIIMPRMDGFTMIEALRKNTPTAKIPVVINSHLAREEDQRRAQDLNVDDFIVRDLTPPREVVERISAILTGGYYYLDFDTNTKEAQRLMSDLRISSFFACENEQKMKLKMKLVNTKEQKFEAEIICPEETNGPTDTSME
ncbi:MAG: response regulator [Candidatus Moranbacteria bacterium]|nr:response regulator [Candidatus Moranbacteria bacterium]